jgi:hypothetical protein
VLCPVICGGSSGFQGNSRFVTNNTQFINEGLVAAKDLGIMDLSLIPYGNAREAPAAGGGYEYTCQHGPAECDGNRILVRASGS